MLFCKSLQQIHSMWRFRISPPSNTHDIIIRKTNLAEKEKITQFLQWAVIIVTELWTHRTNHQEGKWFNAMPQSLSPLPRAPSPSVSMCCLPKWGSVAPAILGRRIRTSTKSTEQLGDTPKHYMINYRLFSAPRFVVKSLENTKCKWSMSRKGKNYTTQWQTTFTMK